MFKISTSRGAGSSFWLTQLLFRVDVERVLNVLLVRKKLQVFNPVVASVQVLVVDFQAAWDRAVKSLPYGAVYANMLVNAVFAGRKRHVLVLINLLFDRSRFSVPGPSVPVLDGEHRCDAGAKKRRYRLERGFFLQHLFCLLDLLGGKLFAPRNAPHVAQIADLVQSFVAKHCFPIFHDKPPVVMNQKFNPIFVGLQA